MRQIMGFLVLLLILVTTSTTLAGQPVHGTVYEADGTPAANTRVWASPVSLDPQPIVHGVTDESGLFSLTLEDGRWFVMAAKGSMGGSATDPSRPVIVRTGQPVAPMNIQMVERGTLTGKVTAAVTGESITEAGLYLDNGELLTTDQDGRYKVGGMSLGGHSLFVVAKGYQRTRVLLDTMRRPKARLDIELKPGGRLTGTVLDKDGRPIPGAYVRRSTSGNMLAMRGLIAFCDEQGRYDFDGLSLDVNNCVSFWAPGYEVDETHSNIFVSSIDPHEQLNVTLMQSHKPGQVGDNQPAASTPTAFKLRDLSGIVTSPDDQPCAEAEVRWGATEYETVDRSVLTDTDGRFILTDVPDHEGYITVMADRYAPRYVRVPEGSQPLPVIRLMPGLRVKGCVVNEAGDPLSDVLIIPVIASPDSSLCNPLWLNKRQTYSGEDGRFELSALPNGCLFDFLRSGMSDRRNYPLMAVDADNTVVMTSTGAICGRVVDQDGKPVTQFRILLNIPNDMKPGERVGGYFAGFCWPGISFTDPDGWFLVSDLTVGNVQSVSVWSNDHGMATVNRVTAKPADQLNDNDAVQIVVGPAHKLAVRIKDESGPIENAIVYAIHNEPGRGQRFDWNWEMQTWKPALNQRTDAKGYAQWDAIPLDDTIIAVDCVGYGRQRYPWLAGEDAPVLILQPEAIVEGFASDSEGRTVSHGYITLTSEQGDVFSATLHPQANGRFYFDRLPAGNYEYRVASDRQALDHRSFTLEPGQTLTLGRKTADASR